MVYLSGSAISGLLGCSLMNANKRMHRGHFGPLLLRANRPYVALSAVEHHIGRQFTEAQLALVAADHRGRIITIANQEVP